jgi:hypothetical protein
LINKIEKEVEGSVTQYQLSVLESLPTIHKRQIHYIKKIRKFIKIIIKAQKMYVNLVIRKIHEKFLSRKYSTPENQQEIFTT